MTASAADRQFLRDLAEQVAEIAADPMQEVKLAEWKRHNSLKPGKPLIVQAPEGVWDEFVPRDSLACGDELARGVEHDLRTRIYHAEHFRDDEPISGEVLTTVYADETDWGIEADTTEGERLPPYGAVRFNKVLPDDADVETIIKDRTVTVDWDRTNRECEQVAELIGDIMSVKVGGMRGFAICPMDLFGSWRGYEQMMIDMIDSPDWVHRALQRITDVHISVAGQFEAQGALGLNCGICRVGSGGLGATDELPAEDFDGTHVRLKDMWGHATTQIFSEVSPAMHDEFAIRYETQFLELFGLGAYGCCEPLHKKVHLVRKLPRVRQLSMSPWVEPNEGAENVGRDFVFSYRPNPSLLATNLWDIEPCRQEMITVLQACKRNGCILEMVMKDTHTCRGEPERYDQWTDAAMELAEEYA